MQNAQVVMPPPPPRMPSLTLYAALEHFAYLIKHNLDDDDLAMDIVKHVFPKRFKCYDAAFANPANMTLGVWPIKNQDEPIRFSLINTNTLVEYNIQCMKEGDILLFEGKVTRTALPTLTNEPAPTTCSTGM
jgi:hypothetical protein